MHGHTRLDPPASSAFQLHIDMINVLLIQVQHSYFNDCTGDCIQTVMRLITLLKSNMGLALRRYVRGLVPRPQLPPPALAPLLTPSPPPASQPTGARPKEKTKKKKKH